MLRLPLLALFVLSAVAPAAARAQSGDRPAIRAGSPDGPLDLDGRLNESAWRNAPAIENLTTIEPREGVPPVGRTTVRILANARELVKVSGGGTWWFGKFYDGTLHQLSASLQFKPSQSATFELTGERNIGDVSAGEFAQDLVRGRVSVRGVQPQPGERGRSLGAGFESAAGKGAVRGTDVSRETSTPQAARPPSPADRP